MSIDSLITFTTQAVVIAEIIIFLY